MYKTWQVREDGMLFRGYRKNKKGELLEHWVSPEVAARRKAYQKEHYKKYKQRNRQVPEKLKELRAYAAAYVREARRKRPEVAMLNRVKTRAKNKGLAFTITRADVYIPDVCPVLGIPLAIGDGYATDNSPELDRIDNAKGYIKDNVIVVSRRANRIKNDATVEELERIASFYKALMSKP